MKISGAIISKNDNQNLKNPIDKNTITAFLSIGLGIVSGCIIFIFSNEADINAIGEYFINFSLNFYKNTKLEVLSGLLFADVPFVLLILILGTSIIGKPFIHLINILKGSGLGFLASLLYCTYGLEGLEYCLLVFYPGKIVFLFSLILASKNALTFSDKTKNSEYDVNKYIISSSIVLFFAVLSCLTDFILIISFSSLFSF